MPQFPSSDALLSSKRLRKRVRRKARITRLLHLAKIQMQLRRQRFGDRSQIIRKLADSYKQKIDGAGANIVVRLPKIFSIIEDPIRSIATIQAFAKTLLERRIRSIDFDQAKIETYDLAAMALLDIVATELVVESKQRGQRLRLSGKYPKQTGVRRFVRSMGLVKHLKVPHEVATGTEIEKIRVFDRRNRHYFAKHDPRKADFKSKTIVGFVDHINGCLKDHKRTLTLESRAKLCDYVGEILCNAEDHPGFVDWTIQGYLDNSLEVPICEIAIFNFGKSIAETLKALPDSSYTRRQIDGYVILHNGRQFFSPDWRQSDLLTLLALQGHVSSKNVTERDTRGQGMGDLIDFFQRVHKECTDCNEISAKMAIISGGTYILFDGTYQMRDSGNRGRVIAFNRQNDLASRPDPAFVKPLGNLHFPGTVISIRFPLSAASTLTTGEQ